MINPKIAQLPENVRSYWEEKQQQTGEQLQLFSYAILVEVTQFPPLEKSGLLYLMERHLWFEDFQKPGFFLFNTTPSYQKTMIQIARQTLTQVELMRESALEQALFGRKWRSGGFSRLFQFLSPDPKYLVISATSETKSSARYVFRDLEQPEEWVQALQPSHP